eukprot:TRINITY_DN1399_c0_g1_i1.p1 TRINITY_DN1399_c0_g1~~TRINITY_DN1399_c0_g1_i1.p1  ORF type:complete len:636 (+),score=75.15 TRINITY_DN1399_c0_g1_i1:90-1997(+)
MKPLPSKTPTPLPFLNVHGLDKTVNEKILKRHFERINRSIRIKRITILQEPQVLVSTNSAMIEFGSIEDAEKAFKVFNYSELLGQELNLMWYMSLDQTDESIQKLLVENLPPSTKSKELFKIFFSFGKIHFCRVQYDKEGLCSGQGQVWFENKQAADKAMLIVNGKILHGSRITVRPLKNNATEDAKRDGSLFVKGFPKEFTHENLKNLFEPYGEVVGAVVIKEKADSEGNKGFGYVYFKEPTDAKVAEEKLNNTKIKGQTLCVSRVLTLQEHRKKMHQERLEMIKEHLLCLNNVPGKVSEEELKKGFERFGNILSVKIIKGQDKEIAKGNAGEEPNNFGFLYFSNNEELKKAMTAIKEGQEILGLSLTLGITDEETTSKTKDYKSYHQLLKGIYEMSAIHSEPVPCGLSTNDGFCLSRHMDKYNVSMMVGSQTMNLSDLTDSTKHTQSSDEIVVSESETTSHSSEQKQIQPSVSEKSSELLSKTELTSHSTAKTPLPGSDFDVGKIAPPPGLGQTRYPVLPAPPEPLPNDRKRLGKILHQMVQEMEPHNSDKIADMFLMMEIEEIQNIIRNPSKLSQWVDDIRKALDTTPKKVKVGNLEKELAFNCISFATNTRIIGNKELTQRQDCVIHQVKK